MSTNRNSALPRLPAARHPASAFFICASQMIRSPFALAAISKGIWHERAEHIASVLQTASARCATFLYPGRAACVRVSQFLRSPFALMTLSVWAVFCCFVAHSVATALWMLPVAAAISFGYLAFTAWYYANHQDEAYSPWSVPTIAALCAVIDLAIRLILR